jgi:hypothetical protein
MDVASSEGQKRMTKAQNVYFSIENDQIKCNRRPNPLKIILISHFFPPNPAARSLQIGKVKSAIESLGIDIRVIAGSNKSNKDTIQWDQPHQNVYLVPYSSINIGQSFSARLLIRVYRELMTINPHNPWVRDVFKKALSLAKEFKPDLIMTSSTPFESHMVGLKLKKYFGLPWVASFSDPWPSAISPAPYNSYEIPGIKNFQMYYLRSVLSHCDAMHMTNMHAIKLTEQKTKVNLSQKGFSIPHIGSKNNNNDAAVKVDDGWLIHIGFLTRERVSPQLLEGIRTAVISNSNRFKGLLLVGKVSIEFKSLVDKMGMKDMVHYHGSVSQKDAMAIANRAIALLVLEADMPESPFLPSKFADYALVGRPIIAVTPKRSPIRQYLSRYGGGYAVSHDGKEISDAIKMVLMKDTDQLIHKNTLSNRFTSRSIGLRYKDMFENILAK